MVHVELYTRDNCPYCDGAKTLLRAKGVDFQEIDVLSDETLLQQMKERSGRRTVPQIFIEDFHVGGFDDLADLEAKGGLDKLLGLSSKAEKKTSHHRVIVVGSGPAGYTAAIYAERAGLQPVLVSGMDVGGQLVSTTEIENWPGGGEELQGPGLMDDMREHTIRTGVDLRQDVITDVDFAERPFKLFGEHANFTADAVIIATGAKAKYLGLPSEDRLMGKGISACATCDGFFFKDKNVVVIGGGNTAVEEAIYLSNIVNHVTLIHRRDTLKAERILQDRLSDLQKSGRVSIEWDSVVDEFVGDAAGLTGVRIRNVRSETEKTVSVDGAFVAIGHDPSTDMFSQWLERDSGYLRVKGGLNGNATQTSLPGVFAAGDVSDPVYRQAVTSAASGAMAALDAERFLQHAAA